MTNITKEFIYSNGQLLFTDNQYPICFKDVFFVKVGAVSGADPIFTNEEHANKDFVCSYTCKTGKTKKMIYNVNIPYLENFKDKLIKRKVNNFDESNWWMWGRSHYVSNKKRVYVNSKIRCEKPFFTNDCLNYDGSVLAVFPHNQEVDIKEVCEELNKVNWFELGFVCDGRFLFSQKSLENTPLPLSFAKFLPPKEPLLFD